MIEQMVKQECEISIDELMASIEEKGKEIDRNLAEIKQLLSSSEVSLNKDRVLYHSMDRMLDERLELAEAKALVVLEKTPKSLIVS